VAALRELIDKRPNAEQLIALAQAYVSISDKVSEGNSIADDVINSLHEAIVKSTDSYLLSALARVYAELASQVSDDDARVVDVAVILREAIGKTTDSRQLAVLSQAYAAVVAEFDDDDPAVLNETAALRQIIAKTIYAEQLRAFGEAYRAVVGKLRGPQATQEILELRSDIGRTTYSRQIGALIPGYAVLSRIVPPQSSSERDVALLLERIKVLRSSSECLAFGEALKGAIVMGSDPLPWDKIGLIYTAALLEPVAAGAPASQLVKDYEQFLSQRPNAPKVAETWSGDVWKFVAWAQRNLPSFNAYKPKINFLPAWR
jgi:hypothetical protein